MFTGEAYSECTFTLEYSDLQFVDKKNVNVIAISLGTPQKFPA